jgi:folate-dependent phosphoribosylglycinamide formyltransferase PurN
LQTLILLGGVAATLFGWGYTLSGIQTATTDNGIAVAQLTVRLEQNDSKTNLLDSRVSALEHIAADAIALRRELETTVGQFKSDLAVIKEILTRIEKENGRAVRP